MTNQTHLSKIGSTYYFRARIPADIQWLYGKPEEKFSLKTKDKPTARRRARVESLRLAREYDERRYQLKLSRGEIEPIKLNNASDAEISEIANRWLYEVLSTDDHQRMEGMETDYFVERKVMVSEGLPFLRNSLAQGNIEVVQQVVGTFLHLLGVDQDISVQTNRRLSYAFLKSSVSYFEALGLRNNGEVKETADVVNTEQLFPINAAGKEGNSMQVLLEDWKVAAVKRPIKTIKDAELVVNQFLEVIENKAADKIKRTDVVEFQEFLSGEGLHHSTVKKKIGFLSSIFTVAIKKEKMIDNPALGVDVPKVKVEEDRRVPFEYHELNDIFSSDIYSKKERPKGGAGDASVWLPLLALYTGARLEELAQLHVVDIKHDKKLDCHYIFIYKGGIRTVKSKSSIRRVPLHSIIIRAGFVKYLDSIKAQSAKMLFPDLKPDCYDKISGNWSKWFGRYLRDVVGITDHKKVYHSFRHCFKDACREAEIPEEVHDALTGHANKSVGRDYGGKFPLKPLFNAIEKVTTQCSSKMHGDCSECLDFAPEVVLVRTE